ncbi:MAG: patatin-like phospholipase family protein [Prevotella sp.]|nr:patatin-like phospholipase family protein [Prevotella sp.]
MNYRKSILTLLVMIAASMSAQELKVVDKDSTRKTVAVVLSGGGAKGMGHIGVLKVLEKAGIPIDIITGTSMGSIIGGLYSIGYNANSLDSMVRVQDWSYVITDKEDMSRQSLGDRKKQNTYFYTTGLTLGKRDVNAGGIIKGKNLAELFQQLCWGFTDSLNFSSDLPKPFACVATDIIDNSEVVFHSGRLPQAMRASMAIPAAFSPVRMGDKVLVDGGLKNNYPADIAREMGADIIIGVSVQGAPKTAEEIGGTMSILNQIIDINCKNKYDDNVAITDLLMKVDTKGYSPASFSQAAIDTLIRRGEEEAMRHWDELIALKERIGMKKDSFPELLHPLRPGVMTDKHRILGYTFENMTQQDERFLRQKFGLNKRDSIDAKLEQELTTSMRVDLFYQTAECRLVPVKLLDNTRRMRIPGIYHEQDSIWGHADGVRVVLTAGERKTVQLHGGVRYDNEEYAAMQLGLDIPLKSKTPINTDITLRLGKRLMARGELTIHPSSFTSPMLSYAFHRNDVDVYTNGDLDYNIRYNQFQAELLPINVNLSRFNLKMGLRWDFMHYRDKLGSESSMQVELENEHFYSYRARLNFNSENNWNFPTSGVRFNAEYAYLTDNFTKLDDKAGLSEVSADWRISFLFGSRFTIQPMIYGRFFFGSVVPPVFGNTIGGDWFGHYVEQQMPFAGIGNMEYVKHQLLAAQVQAQQHIGSSSYVLFKVAVAQHADKVKQLLDNRTLVGVQGSYFYNTMFGPVGGSVGYSNRTKKPYVFLNIGFVF